LLGVEHHGPPFGRNDVHLVDQAKDARRVTLLGDGVDAALVVGEVLVLLAGLDVKHVDQDGHIPEDVVTLSLKVALQEDLLAAAVPDVEDQVAHEPNCRVLDVHCDGCTARGNERAVSCHSTATGLVLAQARAGQAVVGGLTSRVEALGLAGCERRSGIATGG